MKRIWIDLGAASTGTDCRETVPRADEMIGAALNAELRTRGCETRTSCGGAWLALPPSHADAAWLRDADCLLKLRVSVSPDPCRGCAEAAGGNDRRSRLIARSLLAALEKETDLCPCGNRFGRGGSNLRRAPCPAVCVVLRLPHREWESGEESVMRRYAWALTNGLEVVL